MKILFFKILFLLIFISCQAQPDSAYIEACWKINFKMLENNTARKTVVDTCNNVSYIKEGTVRKGYIKDMFELNGFYSEYWDANFSIPKIVGFYFRASPIGLWQEYYPNGKLLSKGNCKVLSFMNKVTNNIGTIKIVDQFSPLDTIKIKESINFYDSMNKLSFYFGVHQSDLKPENKKDRYFPFPSFKSVKIGEWVYYSDSGILIKREYYKDGKLLNTSYK